MLEITTLGGFSVGVNGQALQNIGSHKARALLAYLAVESKPHSRAELVTLFWPESTEQHASTSLRVVLSELRRSVRGYLDISREAVAISSDAKVHLDVADLERNLAAGNIEQALEIYQGDFLKGFHMRGSAQFEDWLRVEQEQLRSRLAGAIHDAISQAIDAGDYAKGHTFVKRLLELDLLDEVAHYQRILLLALDGQRAAALAQYEKCCETLREELGAEPSADLQQLHERILRGDSPASLKPVLPEHNLPAPQTSLVGRENELVKIRGLVRDPACRLLTLVGPGGSGKTRLALQAASESLRSFSDGTFYVPLESANSADDLIPAIARALQFTLDSFINGADLRTQILDYLRKKSILLVLDGCERIAGNAVDLAAILERAPNVRVLATSRQRLGLRSERVFPVEGLGVPQTVEEMRPDGMQAIRLFRERAEQAAADFQLSTADYEPVVRICKMVEGMPLGIELAAAWMSILSPLEIAEAAGKSLDFLTTTMGDMPEKHRSLRAVFDGSWFLLTDDLRDTFSKLSVFRGPFDVQAAQQVAGANLEQLSGLLNRSLLRKAEAGHFTMHSLLRQYAAEKLNESKAVERQMQDRFCHYYADMATRRERELMGPGMLQARDHIRKEMDNFRVAINWAAVHWPEESSRKLLISLVAFYAIHGWQEGVFAFRDIARIRKDALVAGGAPEPFKDPVYLSARIHQAFYQCNLGLIAESEAISRECLQALRRPGLESELSVCLQNLGVNASYRGEYGSSRELLEEAILLGRQCDHVIWPTYLLWLGNVYFQLGEYEQGLLSLQKSYDHFDRQGTLWGTAFALSKIAMAEDGLGDHARAKKHHQEALSVFDRLESKAGKAYALSRMSMSAYFLEHYPEAAQLAQQGYEAFDEIGHRWGVCTSLCALGFANIGLGERAKAEAFFRKALRESRPDQIVPQSLYALIGLACCIAQEGEQEKALELIEYVRKHPETPSIYLEQAVRWIGSLEQAPLPDGGPAASVDGDLEDVYEIVQRLLG
ncbi:MAG TPA: BTAD domain-containing putative transcriptional regulator [Anaerolineales bacterium]